ncbi:MAG: CRISPR-associated endonuclease Cas2 [Candidatus Spechtbacterales bacterium]
MQHSRKFPKPGGSRTREILLYAAAAGTLVVAASLSPSASRFLMGNLAREAKKLFEEGDLSLGPKAIQASLYQIKQDRYAKWVYDKKKGVARLELTKLGKELLQGYQLNTLQIQQPKRWDGQWRFVMFDVPEKSRYVRNILRDKLKKMGFFQVQQSVWVHPYPCQEEVQLLAEWLGAERFLLLFEGAIRQEDTLKNYFKKRGFAL